MKYTRSICFVVPSWKHLSSTLKLVPSPVYKKNVDTFEKSLFCVQSFGNKYVNKQIIYQPSIFV